MNETVQANKSLGQHWLEDEATLKEICRAAGIEDGETILEIGPGKGSLTTELLSSGAEVIAVELDKSLAADLQGKFANQKFNLVVQNITKFDLTTLPAGYKVVANIPYYLTGHLLQLLSEAPNPPSLAVLLVQKEVAQRVCAGPGEGSLLSISVQYYFKASLGKIVPAALFSPPPKVDSQILILNRRGRPLFSGVDEKIFFRVVKAGFSNKRKTLLNSLSGGLRLPKGEVMEILKLAYITASKRPQELNLDEWHSLYKAVKPHLTNNT